jgi:hypothetical protein
VPEAIFRVRLPVERLASTFRNIQIEELICTARDAHAAKRDMNWQEFFIGRLSLAHVLQGQIRFALCAAPDCDGPVKSFEGAIESAMVIAAGNL